MNILIIGFQRSGTTLLRRLLQLHPEVKKLFHESFFLVKCKSKGQLLQTVDQRGFDVFKDTWGEKVPYYPNLRGIPVKKYCERWNSYFRENSRILHIIRHPYDVAVSNVNKFKHINSHKTPINLYKRGVTNAINATKKMKTCYTFKYEDLLINSDEIVFKIYQHCGLTPDIDYKKRMSRITNKRYQSIDPSRAFAYSEQNLKMKHDLNSVIELVNKIGGPKYEL